MGFFTIWVVVAFVCKHLFTCREFYAGSPRPHSFFWNDFSGGFGSRNITLRGS